MLLSLAIVLVFTPKPPQISLTHGIFALTSWKVSCFPSINRNSSSQRVCVCVRGALTEIARDPAVCRWPLHLWCHIIPIYNRKYVMEGLMRKRRRLHQHHSCERDSPALWLAVGHCPAATRVPRTTWKQGEMRGTARTWDVACGGTEFFRKSTVPPGQ